MEVNGVNVIYGFQFDSIRCMEGEKYIICDGKLFYKGSEDELSEKVAFCKTFFLDVYVRDDKTYIGFRFARYRKQGCTGLHLFHQRMKTLEEYKPQMVEILRDIAVDCDIDVEEFDFISIPIACKSKIED